jgi:hypothetical protein
MSQFSKMFGANLKKARSKYFTRAVEFVKASQKSLPWLTYSHLCSLRKRYPHAQTGSNRHLWHNNCRSPQMNSSVFLKVKNNIENTDLHTIEQFINKHLQADEEPAVISADSDDYRSNFVEIHSKYNNNFLQIHKSEFLDCLEKAHKKFYYQLWTRALI